MHKTKTRIEKLTIVDAQEVDIGKIIVPAGRRQIGDITDLMASIKELGLDNPVTITSDFVLIAGRRRLEACRQLGMKSISVTIRTYDKVQAERAELDENLERQELTALERVENLARRDRLYKSDHPESRRGNTKERTKVKRNNLILVKSFAETAAQKLGVDKRTIQQDVKLANDLPKDVRDLIRPTKVANRKKDLTKLSSYNHKMQRKLADVISQGATLKQAEQTVQGSNRRLSDPHMALESILKNLNLMISKAQEFGTFQLYFERCSPEARLNLLRQFEPIHTELGVWVYCLSRT